MTQRSKRFWIEATLAAVSGVLLIVTLINKEWIEVVFGVDPDGGSGRLEWGITLVLLAIAVGAGAAAVVDWRRAETAEG